MKTELYIDQSNTGRDCFSASIVRFILYLLTDEREKNAEKDLGDNEYIHVNNHRTYTYIYRSDLVVRNKE